MINFKSPDEDFNLRNVEDEEIFNAIKKELINTIKTYKGYENIDSKDIILNTKYTTRRNSIFDDGNMYPIITMDINVNSLYLDGFNLIVDPFTIKLVPQKYEAEAIEDPRLTDSFTKFMLLKFPKSDYTQKREEFFYKIKLNQSIREKLLFI